MIEIMFEKLFGRFDYDFTLNENGLTILTGPNGYGKTTILKSIEAIGSEWLGIMYFYSFDFKRIKVLFENKDEIIIEKKKDLIVVNGVRIKRSRVQNRLRGLLSWNPYLDRINEMGAETHKETKYQSYEYFMNYLNYLKGYRGDGYLGKLDKNSDDLGRLLGKMKDMIGDVYFIREQRLIRTNKNRDSEEIINTIEELPQKFSDLMSSIQQAYSSISSKLDSSYPNRLFSNELAISEEEYKQKIKEIIYKFSKLKKYNLLEMDLTMNFVFKEEHAKALKVYFDDFEKKYSVYEEFISKLDLYTNIINDRLSFKKVRFSRKNGIDVVDEHDNILKLNQLSSGEKQEVVLFYELIFNTKNNVLLLIDEPEISLHISWQKKFLDDLLSIINYKGINAIVATHSPQIINNHWDQQVDLGELYGKELNKK